MKSQGSGQRVLRFAVTGALLGGGAATGCAKRGDTVNVAPVEEHTNAGRMEEPPPEEPHTNVGPEVEPHSNAGPEDEPAADPPDPDETANAAPVKEPVPPKYVNTRKVDDKPPPAEKPTIIANPAPQPDPGNE